MRLCFANGIVALQPDGSGPFRDSKESAKTPNFKARRSTLPLGSSGKDSWWKAEAAVTEGSRWTVNSDTHLIHIWYTSQNFLKTFITFSSFPKAVPPVRLGPSQPNAVALHSSAAAPPGASAACRVVWRRRLWTPQRQKARSLAANSTHSELENIENMCLTLQNFVVKRVLELWQNVANRDLFWCPTFSGIKQEDCSCIYLPSVVSLWLGMLWKYSAHMWRLWLRAKVQSFVTTKWQFRNEKCWIAWITSNIYVSKNLPKLRHLWMCL